MSLKINITHIDLQVPFFFQFTERIGLILAVLLNQICNLNALLLDIHFQICYHISQGFLIASSASNQIHHFSYWAGASGILMFSFLGSHTSSSEPPP